MDANTAYRDLIAHIKETNLLGSTASLLGWEQETMMPEGGGAVGFRAGQMGLLARLIHERSTDPRMGDWLAAAEGGRELLADPLSASAVNLREFRRQFDIARKIPAALAEEAARAGAVSKHAWAEARKANDFAAFRPHLETMIDINRSKADCWGWESDGEPWDALADKYEPNLTAADVERLFAPLRRDLVALVNDILGRGRRPDARFNEIKLPVETQTKFVRFVAQQVGFDFTRGRLDTSSHPFCCGLHRDDVRLTTRFHESMLSDSLGSTLHESGHGIYEQNLPGGDNIGTPMGETVSLSIHESQSRMIENQVGRSKAFWRWCFPKLREYFGAAVAGLSFEDVYGAINLVERSLIRTESDEATYNLHIMIRFELERALIKGDLKARDLPGAWNERYKQYLGVDVPDDARGCMQDIHWSMGAMGYFPTYTMGNLYAAQFFEKARADLGDVDAQFERGEFAPLIGWLNRNIHAEGMRYRSADLCMHVTGKALTAEPLLRHLRGKLGDVYGLGQ
jgi:carboxypeptidase Taq